MSSIYNKKKYNDLLDGGLTGSSSANSVVPATRKDVVQRDELEVEVVPQEGKSSYLSELKAYQERSNFAMKLVDDIVLKDYLTSLSDMDIIAASKDVQDTSNMILFKINEMVYEKDEYATDKFISVISAMTFTESSVFLIVDGHKIVQTFTLALNVKTRNVRRVMWQTH